MNSWHVQEAKARPIEFLDAVKGPLVLRRRGVELCDYFIVISFSTRSE